jgi:hypothetical protein
MPMGFIMKRYWILPKDFSVSIEMIMWFYYYYFFTIRVWTQPFFVMVYFWGKVSWTICWLAFWTSILLISASLVARITGVSHRYLAWSCDFCLYSLYVKYYIYWFAYVEPSCVPGMKLTWSWCVMLLNLICKNFNENFCVYPHWGNWCIIFFVMLLSSFALG